MKKLLLASAILMSPLMAINAHATESASTVVFANDSYCGNFSGNIYNGKRFQLRLGADQELVIRNKGGDQISVAYVDGPNGRLKGNRHESYSSYYTQANGNHYIKVYGTSRYSSVDFCAY